MHSAHSIHFGHHQNISATRSFPEEPQPLNIEHSDGHHCQKHKEAVAINRLYTIKLAIQNAVLRGDQGLYTPHLLHLTTR